MDKRVEIHGTSRADMNGKCGVATDFHYDEDQSKWRYTVQLDSGQPPSSSRRTCAPMGRVVRGARARGRRARGRRGGVGGSKECVEESNV